MSEKSPVSPKLSVHMVVKNEEKWIWYSIMSVIDYVDDINIVDTGSTDKTIEIISSIKSSKIKFSQKPICSKDEFTQIRNNQLTECKADWVLLLDGDEVWTDSAITNSINKIHENLELKYLINSYVNCIGDVYHTLPSSAGKYHIKSFKGNISIRWFKNKNVQFSFPYGREGLTIDKDTLIQNSDYKYDYITNPYFHMTHLTRSNSNSDEVFMRKSKYKFELGIATSFEFPKTFYLVRPKIVSSPWIKRGKLYVVNALWQTPLKKLKRQFTND